MKEIQNLTFKPVTPETWDDFELLFGPRGASGGCWCMWFRLSRAQFEQQKGDGNKEAMHHIVNSGEVPGILAYSSKQPVGWCSVAPREHFSALERSRVLKRVDNELVWSIVCFFIAKPYRRKGVMRRLLQAAVEYAISQGAKIIEGYPIEPKKGVTPDVFAYHGLSSIFLETGFQEVARRSQTHPIMRYFVNEQ
ncbi:MAG: GNAT family N-acetyltransferase [Anaerolineales bacterium]|nr:GNAT family N-acetyltransferase [Anaerolineales bacterium]